MSNRRIELNCAVDTPQISYIG